MSLEAMDRETDRETRVQNVSNSSFPAHAQGPAARAQDTPASGGLEQCLAQEAALQACRLMPGFGKDICKSGVRAKYAGAACP